MSDLHSMPTIGPGSVFAGRYELLKPIGQGGMGEVYAARQISIGRTVALKMLKPSLCSDEEQVKRFQREAQLVSQLEHANTITLFDFDIEEGVPYIAMEFLTGLPLDELLTEEGPLHPLRAAKIFTQICDSLAEAHQKQLVHRDLKPENIFLINREGQQDFVKVLDFGIAKPVGPQGDKQNGGNLQSLTQGNIIYGTPHYMSPEHIHAEPIDHRSDVYALGVMLYQVLTGKLPYNSAKAVDIFFMHIRDPLPTFAAPLSGVDTTQTEALQALIHSAMAKNRDERLESVQAFGEQLKQIFPETMGFIPPLSTHFEQDFATKSLLTRYVQPTGILCTAGLFLALLLGSSDGKLQLGARWLPELFDLEEEIGESDLQRLDFIGLNGEEKSETTPSSAKSTGAEKSTAGEAAPVPSSGEAAAGESASPKADAAGATQSAGAETKAPSTDERRASAEDKPEGEAGAPREVTATPSRDAEARAGVAAAAAAAAVPERPSAKGETAGAAGKATESEASASTRRGARRSKPRAKPRRARKLPPNMGMLRVSTRPRTKIYLDGEPVSTRKYRRGSGQLVRSGRHTLLCELAGREPIRRLVVIHAGKRKRVRCF